jgi:hypothetical protein
VVDAVADQSGLQVNAVVLLEDRSVDVHQDAPHRRVLTVFLSILADAIAFLALHL